MNKDLIGLTHNDWCEIQLPKTYQKIHTKVTSLGITNQGVSEVRFANGSAFKIDGTPVNSNSGTFIRRLRPRDVKVNVNEFCGKITRERVYDRPQLSHIRLFYTDEKFMIIPTDSCVHYAEDIIDVISAQEAIPRTHKHFVINTLLINVVSLNFGRQINITLTNLGKREVFKLAYENHSIIDIIKRLFNSLEDTELEQIDPDDVGALTNSPMLGFKSSDMPGYDRVWWFPDYQVVNEVTELLYLSGWTMQWSPIDKYDDEFHNEPT